MKGNDLNRLVVAVYNVPKNSTASTFFLNNPANVKEEMINDRMALQEAGLMGKFKSWPSSDVKFNRRRILTDMQTYTNKYKGQQRATKADVIAALEEHRGVMSTAFLERYNRFVNGDNGDDGNDGDNHNDNNEVAPAPEKPVKPVKPTKRPAVEDEDHVEYFQPLGAAGGKGVLRVTKSHKKDYSNDSNGSNADAVEALQTLAELPAVSEAHQNILCHGSCGKVIGREHMSFYISVESVWCFECYAVDSERQFYRPATTINGVTEFVPDSLVADFMRRNCSAVVEEDVQDQGDRLIEEARAFGLFDNVGIQSVVLDLKTCHQQTLPIPDQSVFKTGFEERAFDPIAELLNVSPGRFTNNLGE